MPQTVPENTVFTPEKPCGFGFGNIVAESMVAQPGAKKLVGSTDVLRKFVMVVSVVIISGTSNDQLNPKSVLSKLYIASAFAGAAVARQHVNINTNTIKLVRMRAPWGANRTFPAVLALLKRGDLPHRGLT